MNLGQGSLGLEGRTAPATPATVTAADNGTSLNGTIVEFGQAVGAVGDPAQLLNNREIPLELFSVDFKGVNLNVLINDLASLFSISDSAANPFFLINIAAGYYSLGDDNLVANGTEIFIQDTFNRVTVGGTINGIIGSAFMQLEGGLINVFGIGDVGNNQNGTKIEAHDNVSEIWLTNFVGGAAVRINGTLGFTGTVTPVNSITVDGGIVTNVT